jgi:transcriptional regulator with XRE-family HTH domain
LGEQEERFGKTIRALRHERSFSLRKAAGLVGITHPRLAELEVGRAVSTGKATRPSREVVKRLALAYGEPSDYLLELAGYSREHPDLTADESRALDLLRLLDDVRRKTAIKVLKALADEPDIAGVQGSNLP